MMGGAPGRQEGSERRRLAFFVHGYSCTSKHWSGARERLGPEVGVELVSLPGHDGTPLPSGRRLDVEACVEHVLTAVEARGDCEACLVGHSLGGMIGLACARRRPALLAALVLVDAFPKLGPPHPFDKSFWPGSPAALKSGIVKEMMETRRKLPSSLWESVVAFDARGCLHELSLPVRGVYGDRGEGDREVLHGALRQAGLGRLPDARFHFVPGAGHFVMLEQPDAFYGLVAQILSDLPGG
jgi:pimeloyl-ACP methyl ester carboxylesterase